MYMDYQKVRELFDYDQDTGELIWRYHRSRKCRAGSRVKHLSKSGYIKVHIDKKLYRAHRLIWLWNYGYMPEHDIDHINNIRSDNRLLNLRETSRSCNLYNKIKGDRITGVYQFKDNFDAKIFISGKNIHLGRFNDLTEAVAHRLAAEQCIGVDFYLTTPADNYIRNLYAVGVE